MSEQNRLALEKIVELQEALEKVEKENKSLKKEILERQYEVASKVSPFYLV